MALTAIVVLGHHLPRSRRGATNGTPSLPYETLMRQTGLSHACSLKAMVNHLHPHGARLHPPPPLKPLHLARGK